MFPSLAKSTISNYLGVGRDVYIPALTGKLTDEADANAAFAALPPSTALVIKGALKDAATKDVVVKEVAARGKAMSYDAARAMVKRAKEAANQTPGKDNTPKPDADAAAKVAQAELEAMVARWFVTAETADEISITIDKEYKAQVRNFLKAALETPEQSQAALKLLTARIAAYLK